MFPDPTEDSAAPFCPYFGTCGGCTLQHYGPASYDALKRGVVDDALRSHKVAATLEATIGAHGDGRSRATLHARGGRVGYMAARSHELVDILACPILVPPLQE